MAEAHTTVLLIEDDDVDREAVHHLIGDVFVITDASTGAAGKALFEAARPDCVLLDYHLPDLESWALLDQFVAAGTPVVMLTGQGDERVAVRAMKMGASDYLVKEEVSRQALQNAVSNALELASLRSKVDEQQKALKIFAHAAAHDLKAPVRQVNVFAQMLLQDLRQGELEEVAETAERLVSVAGRMAKLIEGLLNYAKEGRTRDTFEMVDLGALLEAVVGLLSPGIDAQSAGVQIGPMPTISGDPIGLQQLFQNLLDNGLKFQAPGQTPQLSVRASPAGPSWHFEVEDNGVGVAPEKWDKIFDPLYRAHSSAEFDGTGLGLALCQQIVEQHRGRIWLESVQGEGSTFHVLLPGREDIAAH